MPVQSRPKSPLPPLARAKIGDMVMLDDASMSNISRSGSTQCCFCCSRSRSKYHKHFWPVVNVTPGLSPADKIKLEHQFIPYVANLETQSLSAKARAGYARHAIVFVGIMLITIISLRDTERIQASPTMEDVMFYMAILTTMASTALGNMTRDLQLFEKAALFMRTSMFLKSLGNSLVNRSGPYAGFATVPSALPTFWFQVESLKNAISNEETKILQGKGQEEGMMMRVTSSMKNDTALLPPQGIKGTAEDPLAALYTAMDRVERYSEDSVGVEMDDASVPILGAHITRHVQEGVRLGRREARAEFDIMRRDLLRALSEGGSLAEFARTPPRDGSHSGDHVRRSSGSGEDADAPDFLANALDAAAAVRDAAHTVASDGAVEIAAEHVAIDIEEGQTESSGDGGGGGGEDDMKER